MNRMTKIYRTLSIVIGMIGVIPVAMAQQASGGKSDARANEDLSFTLGIRFWNTQWNANSFPFSGGKQIVAHADSGSKLVPIPTASIRYKDFGVSASHFMNTSYTLDDGLDSFRSSRTETDLNVLYYVLPGLSASLGYKELKWGGVKIDGPTLALSGSAPLGSGFGVYGTAGAGKLELNGDFLNGKGINSDYALGEVGFSYSTNTNAYLLKGLTATAGYRYQKVTAKGLPLSNNVFRDVYDITSGVTFGLIGRF